MKLITSQPHWFYTRILRVPKCFSPQAFSLTPKSAHNLGYIKVFDHTVLQAMQKLEAALERVDRNLYQLGFEFAQT